MSNIGQAMLEAANLIRTTQGYLGQKDAEDIVGLMTSDRSLAVDSTDSSSDLGGFVEEDGKRMFNMLGKLYVLPSDKSEWNRLDLQHAAFYLALGALYPHPSVVQELLKPENGVSKNILDLGCGTGRWAIEVAKEYAHSNVVGLDLAPVPIDADKLPHNLRFEVGDINSGLAKFHGQFDLVHMRAVLSGLKDQRKSLAEIQSCLKPGGLLLIYTPDIHQWAADRKSLVPAATENNLNGSWFQRVFQELEYAVTLNGSDSTTLNGMLYEGFWDSYDIMDPATCGTGNIWIPNGPWASSINTDIDNRLKVSGALMRRNLLQLHRLWQGVIKKFGVEQEVLDEWAKRIDEELTETKFKSWTRIRLVWGRRRGAANEPAPALPIPDIYSSPYAWSNQMELDPAEGHVYQVEVDGSREDGFEKAKDRLKLIDQLRVPTLVPAPQ